MSRGFRFAALPLVAGLAASLSAQPQRTGTASDERRTPIVTAVEKVGPAVVNISAEQLVRRRTTAWEEFFNFGSPDRRERGYRTESLGSGVIIDPTGIVVTNAHVISGASRIFVTTSDGRELEADVLGADADNDLAVLKVDAKNLRSAKLGTTSDILIGETAIAIGNPFGLSNTVTTGIVSALHRSVPGDAGRTYSDFIQTDAAINPGNSGGALVNILGELIGINTAIVGGANTIGFAIPVDRVKRIADDLLRFGEVKPVWLGVRAATLTSDRNRASAKGMGARIRSVYPGSPAEEAGLEEGDVITSVDGRTIESREDFDTALTSAGPGRTLSLEVKRNGKSRLVAVKTTRAPDDIGLEVLRREIGISLAKGRSGGLGITSVARDSPADQKGIERGDQLLAVNGRKVNTLEDVGRAIEVAASRPTMVLVVARGRYAYTITFRLD